jgi:arginine utilization protein RocB
MESDRAAPSLLSLKDCKTGYDVTTPASAFATWNVLAIRVLPKISFRHFEQLCCSALADMLASLNLRARLIGSPHERHSSANSGPALC